MSDAFSLGQVPGMVENLHLIKSGLMARHGRPKSRIQTGFGPWWLARISHREQVHRGSGSAIVLL